MRTTPIIITLLGFALVNSSGPTFGQDTIRWAKDLQSAQETATQDGRLVLLHFWAPHCTPCQAVERYVLTHPEVARAVSANYVPVYVNAKALPDVAKKFGVDRWPTDVIITPSGDVLSRSVSPKDAREYTGLLNRVAAAKVQPQKKWGELAQNTRQPPPTYQASEYQTDPPATRGGAFGGGEFQVASPKFQPSKPTETTSGFGQYGPNGPFPDRRGVAGNSNSPGRGFAPFDGNPRGSDVPERAGPSQPPSQPTDFRNGSLAKNSPSGAIKNQEFDPKAARGEPGRQGSPPTSGGSFGAPADVAGASPSDRDLPAQEWPADNRAPSPRDNRFASSPPSGRPPDSRQVTSELPVVSPASRPEAPLALEGFCPVSLVEAQRPNRDPRPEDLKRGSPKFGAIHRGRTYLFVSQREQQAFLVDPDRYSPVLSGFDPVVFSDTGEFVAGKRQFGVFYGDQIFLFADEAGLERFWKSPAAFARNADQAMKSNAVGNRVR